LERAFGIGTADKRSLIRLHVQNENFFSLSPQAKSDIAHPGGPIPQRGWSRLGAENSAKLNHSGINGGKEGREAQGASEVDLSDSRVSDSLEL